MVESVDCWLEARTLRNRLVHEYMKSAETFSEDLALAKEYSLLLVDSFNRLREFAVTRMGIDKTKLPKQLELAGQD